MLMNANPVTGIVYVSDLTLTKSNIYFITTDLKDGPNRSGYFSSRTFEWTCSNRSLEILVSKTGQTKCKSLQFSPKILLLKARCHKRFYSRFQHCVFTNAFSAILLA